MGESAMIGRTYYDKNRSGWYTKTLVAVFGVITDGALQGWQISWKGATKHHNPDHHYVNRQHHSLQQDIYICRGSCIEIYERSSNTEQALWHLTSN
jgi:hypothetical protein